MALNHIALPETNFLTCNLQNPDRKIFHPNQVPGPTLLNSIPLRHSTSPVLIPWP